jgi:uncharacterized membrane protein
MKPILILCWINTLLFLYPIWKQFMIVARSPDPDEELNKKMGALILSLSMLAAMWLCYFAVRASALFFFLIAVIVLIYKNKK